MIGFSYLNRDHAGHFTSAVFLDRDGTVSEYNGYITRADHLRLADGTGKCLRDLINAGYCCIIVTNQSAIGRGMMTEPQLQLVHEPLLDLLAAEGVTLSAIYYCPDLPDADDEFTVANPDRKPGAGMLRRAAVDLNFDLSASWMIGDRYSDVLAGQNAGCHRSIRVRSGHQYASGAPGTMVARQDTSPRTCSRAPLTRRTSGTKTRRQKVLLLLGSVRAIPR